MLLTTFRKNMFPPKILPKNKTYIFPYEKEKLLAVSLKIKQKIP